jgi:protein-S-isoprenylcysteine O-methyltransferase Ste14
MSLIPVFQLGFWNAWILTLFMLLHPYILSMVDKTFGAGDMYEKMGGTPAEKGQKKPVPIPTLLLVLLFVLSIFIPLKLGTAWLYLGIIIYILGVVMCLNSMITAAKTPCGRVFTDGAYRYSRHPMYLSFLLIFLGISVASLSWLFLLLSMGWMVFPLSQVNGEEQYCLDSLGDEYSLYMQKTPKWLGFPR